MDNSQSFSVGGVNYQKKLEVDLSDREGRPCDRHAPIATTPPCPYCVSRCSAKSSVPMKRGSYSSPTSGSNPGSCCLRVTPRLHRLHSERTNRVIILVTAARS